MTFQQWIANARDRFIVVGIDANEAALDAELLAREILGWTRAQLLIARHAPAPQRFSTAFEALVTRRERREPMAYILGRREFWTLEFDVSPAVLIPRPETELLVEQAIDYGRRMTSAGSGHDPLHVVDVGTGSGCVAISLARELPHATFVATEISMAALDVARRNARRHAVETRIAFRETPGIPELSGPALVVSNPPYVPLADRDTLPPEVLNFEPAAALFGGPDGLDAIRALLGQADAMLPKGFFVFEFGFGQEPAIRTLVDALTRLRLVRIAVDLQRIPRVAVLETR